MDVTEFESAEDEFSSPFLTQFGIYKHQ